MASHRYIIIGIILKKEKQILPVFLAAYCSVKATV
jgi:hypothetical protein